MHLRKALALLAVSALLAMTGCGKKAGVNASVADLERAFPSAGQAAASQGSDSIQSRVASVIAAIKEGNLPRAMDEITILRRQRGFTPDQRMVVNQVAGELEKSLIAQAEKGDAQAKAALDRVTEAAEHRSNRTARPKSD